MEKKQYIQPSLNVVKVSLGTLLVASPNAPTYNPTESFGDEEKVGARRNNYSVWGEEDEEF